MTTYMEKNYDFWNHGIHPITGFFIKDDRIVEVFSSDKYFLKPLIVPKNKHNRKIQIKPSNYLYDKINTA